MRMLVVEDERRIARFIQRGLEERQHAVDVAGDGEEAILLATTNDYDLIALDILLPRKNGLMVCRELRARDIRTPILMLTARDSVADTVAGLNAGADDYLTKPFAFDEFIARVNALVRRRALDCIPTIRVADLELDPLRHEVRRAGRRIELTNKEYALLAFLLQRPGQVFTRTQIAEGVWGLHYDNESNVIEVYMRALRRKIDVGHERPLLYTVRGVGYAVRGDR
ncbi:MAG TPA: response regulator transcription factor [Chloroflexota bacterium]|nr:response regulator transcription factor [Chloroflexota bacterium]